MASKRLAFFALGVCVALAALAAPASAKKKPHHKVAHKAALALTALGIDLALEGTPVAKSELTGIVTAAQVNLNEAADTLDGPWSMGAATAAVEIDVSGPDSADAVLYFIFKSPSAASVSIGEQQYYLGLEYPSQQMGIVPGYPAATDGTRRSLMWTQSSQNALGAPITTTVAAVAVGPVVVEGIAAQSGSAADATSATALAVWGAQHLARAEKTR